MNHEDDGIVSASEIASWAWCPESWRLDSIGEKPTNQGELKKGEAAHAETARFEERSRSAISLGWWLVVASFLLALLAFVLVRG